MKCPLFPGFECPAHCPNHSHNATAPRTEPETREVQGCGPTVGSIFDPLSKLLRKALALHTVAVELLDQIRAGDTDRAWATATRMQDGLAALQKRPDPGADHDDPAHAVYAMFWGLIPPPTAAALELGAVALAHPGLIARDPSGAESLAVRMLRSLHDVVLHRAALVAEICLPRDDSMMFGLPVDSLGSMYTSGLSPHYVSPRGSTRFYENPAPLSLPKGYHHGLFFGALDWSSYLRVIPDRGGRPRSTFSAASRRKSLLTASLRNALPTENGRRTDYRDVEFRSTRERRSAQHRGW